jgi:uncharacterized membrane protein YqhA
MERFFENAMYASRWILAPSIWPSLALIALTIKFFRKSCMFCRTFFLPKRT